MIDKTALEENLRQKYRDTLGTILVDERDEKVTVKFSSMHRLTSFTYHLKNDCYEFFNATFRGISDDVAFNYNGLTAMKIDIEKMINRKSKGGNDD